MLDPVIISNEIIVISASRDRFVARIIGDGYNDDLFEEWKLPGDIQMDTLTFDAVKNLALKFYKELKEKYYGGRDDFKA